MPEALATTELTAVTRDQALTPLPVFTGREMTRALTAYRELQQALDRAMPDQIMDLDGKPFRKKGYWRAIAVAFNLTVEPVAETREVHDTLEGGSDNYTYTVTYRASTPSGRAMSGDGACSAAEKARGRMKASEHNVRSHAHTRAFNRAVSNLVGFGEVSAEEVEHDGPRVVVDEVPTSAALPSVPRGYHYVMGYTCRNGWHEASLLNYDSHGGALKVSTKNSYGALLKEAQDEHVPVQVQTTPKKNAPGEAYLSSVTRLAAPAPDPSAMPTADEVF